VAAGLGITTYTATYCNTADAAHAAKAAGVYMKRIKKTVEMTNSEQDNISTHDKQ